MCRILGETSVVGKDRNISHAHVKDGLLPAAAFSHISGEPVHTSSSSVFTFTVLGSRNRSDVLRNGLEGVFWLSFHIDVLQGQEHTQKKTFQPEASNSIQALLK